MKKSRLGFTLIELMIVIAIIWVLAVTLIPQLTWAQARARDTGRIASLENVKAVLETYNSDYSAYPDWEVNKWCLSQSNWKLSEPILEKMFKNKKAPVDPQKGRLASPCTIPWSYAYVPLKKWGLVNWGYYIAANVEIFTKANTLYKDDIASIDKGGNTEFKKIEDEVWAYTWSLETWNKEPDESTTLYAIIN